MRLSRPGQRAPQARLGKPHKARSVPNPRSSRTTPRGNQTSKNVRKPSSPLASVEQTILLPVWISPHYRDLAKRTLPGVKSRGYSGSCQHQGKAQLRGRKGQGHSHRGLELSPDHLSEHRPSLTPAETLLSGQTLRHHSSLLYTLPRTDRTTFPSQIHLCEARIRASQNTIHGTAH